MKEEWKSVLHSTWLKVVLVAIIAIPMLYAGIFLGSMWDPYGNTGDIPVAVVNQDQAVEYHGTTLDVGNELVKNLKENESMKFSFVDDSTAKKGLEDGSYYMIISIPSDFSKNATTLLEAHPQKMKLEYQTNPGTNYIATKMDDSAMAKIKESVSESVTKTYADTLFSTVKDLSNGLKDASDGSAQLKDGAYSAQDGSKQISDNLKTLASSTLTFENGTETLEKGLSEYTKGSEAIDQGAGKLKDGIASLQEHSGTLVNGVAQLKKGSNDVSYGVSSYTQAVKLLDDSSKQLISQNAVLLHGVTQLSQGNHDMYQGSEVIKKGMETMSDTIGENLTSNAPTLETLQKGNQQSIVMMSNFKTDAETLKKVIDQASEQQQSVIAALTNIKDSTTDNVTATQLEEMITDMNQTQQNYSALSQSLEKLMTSSDDMQALIQGDQEMLQGLSEGLQAVKQNLDKQGTTIDSMGLIQGVTSLQDSLKLMEEGFNGSQGLTNGVKAYTDGVTALSNGVTSIDENSSTLTQGSAQLAQGMNDLYEQMPSLANGIQQLSLGSNDLYQGTSTLIQNNPTLLNGAQQLNDGSIQLASGAHQLSQGSDTLYSGLIQLNDGTSTLQTSLQEGAKQSDIKVSDSTTDMLANPIQLNHQEISTVENNGHAMAPYMMSVGLYVACMAFTLMYPLLKNNIHTRSGLKLWASKAGVMYVVSTLMAVVMIAALMLFNGLSPYQIGMTFALAVLVAAAFMSMIVFFSITCGKIGSFIVLVFMVLQLGGAAGTYPIETSGAFYRMIHPFMPFSYSVDAFRHTLACGGAITQDILVFIGMIVVFSLLSILFYRWKAGISEEQYESTLLAKFH